MKEEAIVKSSPGVLAVQELPDFLKDRLGDRAGMENVTREDTLIPRLCIAQALSPQMKKSNEAFIKDLEVGDLFNSVTGEIYGKSVNVVPLFFWTSFIDFKPIEDGGGINAMYDNVEEVPQGALSWGENGEKPQVTKFANFMILLVRLDSKPMPTCISFKATGLKVAKRWNGMARDLNLPMYSRVYELETITASKGANEWESLRITPRTFVPQEFFNQAEAAFKQLKAVGVQVDTQGLDGEETAPKGSRRDSEDAPF